MSLRWLYIRTVHTHIHIREIRMCKYTRISTRKRNVCVKYINIHMAPCLKKILCVLLSMCTYKLFTRTFKYTNLRTHQRFTIRTCESTCICTCERIYVGVSHFQRLKIVNNKENKSIQIQT